MSSKPAPPPASGPKSRKGLNDGEWRPDYPVKYAPLVSWPPKPVATLRWLLFGYPSWTAPWTLIYVAIAWATWTYFQPPLEAFLEPRSQAFREAALYLYARNFVLQVIFAGGWHLVLVTLRLQGDKGAYWPGPPAVDPKFLFGSQVYDNMFWSLTSGVGTQAAYETFYFWLMAHGKLPRQLDFGAEPALFLGWIFVLILWREFHFYFVHRLIHYPVLYRWVHYLHHKNYRPISWSGMAMHPVEHLFYFSVVLIHLVVPSHPIHFILNSQHTALTPSGGHHGYEGPILNGVVPTGSYFHWLHHRYRECNYGEGTLPLDWAFSTFRDGLPEGEGAALADLGGDADFSAKKNKAA